MEVDLRVNVPGPVTRVQELAGILRPEVDVVATAAPLEVSTHVTPHVPTWRVTETKIHVKLGDKIRPQLTQCAALMIITV